MHLKPITPKQAINKAYLREKVTRADIELFKSKFTDLLNKINEKGDEEHLKSLIADFLKFTWYKDAYQINPIGKNDLVIHTGKLPSDPIGVILEVKSLVNKTEMISEQKPNAKAIHELILYYLNERVTNNKHEIKQLIATNIYEWFVFDANEFDKKIYRNNSIKKLYEQKKADQKDNPWFYEEIKKLLDGNELSLEVTCFDIRNFKKPATNSSNDDDKKLIPLFKILSPVHLLKLPFTNDSNTLQPKFYSELLHLIGLYEYKEGSKKLISRKKETERNAGSLLENAITNLDSHDKISRLDKPMQYGENYPERLYNVALELVITWINRILFLKLLEAQLLNYHKGDKAYTFLNKDKIRDFDDLDKLFFRVLAKKTDERSNDIVKLFGNVPYLNSSLFEPTELEHQTLFINGLEDFVPLPLLNATVLKDDRGKTRKGNLSTLDYLFDFLNAYDFSSEGAEDIQEDNKTLINASVLGLIFEKINGYKDGSFFTPGFITMYMCRETIRRAVVQKFNDAKGWELKDYSELYDKITDKKEANTIINSLKICDPAVGSGHFLVSALNELIAIKSDLNVLISNDGRTLRDHRIEVVNDELIVTDENNDPFKYNFHDLRSQTVQQTLFHEKQTIIENCLFGVDINPNSVKICRLRLWIELLKNAYYKPTTNKSLELETLPNIDINIKTGNSLISRFALDADLKPALKKNKITIDNYRNAVDTYRNARDKAQKREMESIINAIKSNFRTEISRNAKEFKELSKLRGQLEVLLSTNQDLFGVKKSKKELELEQRRLELSIEKQEETIEEIKNNKIYENAFEWRFEFPEVLNEEGDFVGFDIVIGNPPYFSLEKSEIKYFLIENSYSVIEKRGDIYTLFYELGIKILRKSFYLNFITSSTWMRSNYGRSTRNFLLEKSDPILLIDFSDYPVFDSATVLTNIILLSKSSYNGTVECCLIEDNFKKDLKSYVDQYSYSINYRVNDSWSVTSNLKYIIRKKVYSDTKSLCNSGYKIFNGFRTGFNDAYILNHFLAQDLIKKDPKNSILIKKVLRGRDIKRYAVSYEDQYVLIIGHNKHETIVNEFPSIYTYLKQFENQLKNRGQVKNGQHHWLELDNHPNDEYLSAFEKPKIIYPEITKYLPFYLDNEAHFYSNNKTFLISGVHLEFLVSFLNSKLFKFCFRETFPELQGDSRELRKVFMEQLPIKQVDFETNDLFKVLVDSLLKIKLLNNFQDTSNLESQIDQLVYQLYNLTPEEIKIVEGEV